MLLLLLFAARKVARIVQADGFEIFGGAIDHGHGLFEEFCAFAGDAEGPAVFVDAGEVENGFFFAHGGGAEKALENSYECEVEFRGKIPERLQVFGFEAVNEAHGGYETGFSSCAADVKEVRVSAGGEGAEDATVESNFGGEIGEVEVAC